MKESRQRKRAVWLFGCNIILLPSLPSLSLSLSLLSHHQHLSYSIKVL